MEHDKSPLHSNPPAEEVPAPSTAEPVVSVELAKYRQIEGPMSDITKATIADIVERPPLALGRNRLEDKGKSVFFGDL